MTTYIVRRLLLIVPTLLGILLINFAVIQVVPGGPVERTIARIKQGYNRDAAARVSGTGGGEQAGQGQGQGGGLAGASGIQYRGAQGLRPELVAEIERIYGLDRPVHERFFKMVKGYLLLDFGESFFSGKRVVDMMVERLPVSISLGLWTTLLIYGISIPLGIAKAVRDGERFDIVSSAVVSTLYAIPSFLFALMLIILFAGGSFLKLFPLRGLTSPGWQDFGFIWKVADYFWHLALPVTAMVIVGFAGLTLLTKNSFLDELRKQYVVTARAKGLDERRVLYGHVFRNAMLIVISGFPAAFLRIFFASSLLIETIFSIDGLGLMGFEALVNRDYPVVLGTLYIFTLLGLVANLASDLTYVLVDPRIDFEARGA